MSSDPEVPSQTGANRPRGRGRPPTIDTEHLLQVARDVFLERGIRATTLEVAEKAGVSEGSIFNRFKTKEALFRQAMNLDAHEIARLFAAAIDTARGQETRAGLEGLASRLLEIGRLAIPLMMMSWSNPEACTADSQDEKKAAYRGIMMHLVHHFEGQVRSGQLRSVDPEVFARTFLGAIHHYCMVRIMAPEAPHVVVPEVMFVRGLVDILLEGAAPPSGSPGRQP